MAISLGIGPPNDPTTTYTYDLGLVTLSSRPETTRSPDEVTGIVRSIQIFGTAARAHDPGVQVGSVSDPFNFAFGVDGGKLACEFRCPADGGLELVLEAEIDLVSRETTFEERPERTISWGDYLLLLAWMDQVRSFATR